MNQKLLINFSLSISLLGIFLLLFISNQEPKYSSIAELQNFSVGKQVKIIGNITSTSELSKNFFLLTIKDSTGKTQATSNKNFLTNITVEISGKITKFQNKTQIQADKIIKIN